jgi:DNA-binding beta-propeller fold protein YncE
VIEPAPSQGGDDWGIGARIQIPGTPPFGIAIGDRYVWVLQRDAQGGCSRTTPCSLSRIDPQTNRVVGMSIRLGDAWGLTVGAGSVWITQFDGRLIRIDERTGRIQARIRPRSGDFGIAIAFGGGSIWTSSYPRQNRRASLVRIHPQTNTVADKVDPRAVDARTQSIAFGNGAVWLFDHDHFLVKVDPKTMRVVARQQLKFGAFGVIPTMSRVFLADPQGQRLAVADPETARVLRGTALDIAPISLRWAVDPSGHLTRTRGIHPTKTRPSFASIQEPWR